MQKVTHITTHPAVAAELARRDLECTNCGGAGFTLEPECCGRPIQHCTYSKHGEPLELISEECCGSPVPVQVACQCAAPKPVSKYLLRPLRTYEQALKDQQAKREQMKGEVA